MAIGLRNGSRGPLCLRFPCTSCLAPVCQIACKELCQIILKVTDCGWTNGAATGIHVFAQAFAPEVSAIIVDNDVTMSAPEDTVFGAASAGIQVRGFAQGNSVLNNRIRGRARAALAVNNLNAGIPGNNSLVANDLDGFQSSLADIFVDAGVTNTAVIGRQARVEDHGIGTVVVPMP